MFRRIFKDYCKSYNFCSELKHFSSIIFNMKLIIYYKNESLLCFYYLSNNYSGKRNKIYFIHTHIIIYLLSLRIAVMKRNLNTLHMPSRQNSSKDLSSQNIKIFCVKQKLTISSNLIQKFEENDNKQCKYSLIFPIFLLLFLLILSFDVK